MLYPVGMLPGLLLLFLWTGLIVGALWTLGLYYRLTHPYRRTTGWALANDLPTDPGDLGLAYREVQFQLPDGHAAPGWLIAGKDATGPVLVVSHGWGDSRYGLLPRLPLWADLFSSVLLYDLRGHGDSDARASFAGPPEVEDLKAILGQLGEHLKESGPVVLMGLSMGATISLMAAAQDGGAAGPAALIAEGIYRYRLAPVAAYLRRRRWPTFPFLKLIGCYLRLRPGRFSLTDRLPFAEKLRCPALFLHGRLDPICPVADALAMAEAAGRRWAQSGVVIFADAGHLDLAELDPDSYAAALRDFLGKVKRA
ncbi:MAG: alpha/beta hydrolase [Phycisphaeraceae bacterium]|nr:alpha/beta hydrolase [Phycisphaeraceae bacterium]